MFHVKQTRKKLITMVVGLGLLGLAAVGCTPGAGSRGWAGPIEHEGTIFVSTGAGRLDAIDETGRQMWRFPELWEIPERDARRLNGIYGSPVFNADRSVIFLGDYNGFIYAFRPDDLDLVAGEARPLAASLRLSGPSIGGIAYDGPSDSLFAVSGNRVYALRASDMERRIENRDAVVSRTVLLEAEGDIWATPVMANGRLLVASLDGSLYSIDPRNGNIVWQYRAEHGLVATPAVSGNRVLIAGFGSRVIAVNLNTGAEEWTYRAGNWIWGEPAIGNGVAYVGDFSGVVHAINLQDGSEAWRLNLERGTLRASPALSGNNLVVSSDDGWLIGINTSTRERAWERNLGTSLNADLVIRGGQVLLAPERCISVNGGDRAYYISASVANGDLRTATGVC
jgi:outer membrane protein assembly factor BamB